MEDKIDLGDPLAVAIPSDLLQKSGNDFRGHSVGLLTEAVVAHVVNIAICAI
jgi:hypothetical protein